MGVSDLAPPSLRSGGAGTGVKALSERVGGWTNCCWVPGPTFLFFGQTTSGQVLLRALGPLPMGVRGPLHVPQCAEPRPALFLWGLPEVCGWPAGPSWRFLVTGCWDPLCLRVSGAMPGSAKRAMFQGRNCGDLGVTLGVVGLVLRGLSRGRKLGQPHTWQAPSWLLSANPQCSGLGRSQGCPRPRLGP